MTAAPRSRQPKGVSTGGQYATERKGEPDNVIPLHPAPSAVAGAPVREVNEMLEHTKFNQPIVPDVLDRAELIRLPGYVHPEVHDVVVDGLLAAASPEESGDFDYRRYQSQAMQQMADCLPTLGRDEVVAAIQANDADEDPRFEETARQLILADQANRGLTHSYAPSGTVTHRERDAMYSAHTIGSRSGEPRTMAETSKAIKQEIKAAREAGYLPAEFTYGVRKEEYAGGASVYVNVKGLSEEQYVQDDPMDPGFKQLTPVARELKNRVAHIAAIFNRDASDSQVDYFDVDFYAHVNLQTT